MEALVLRSLGRQQRQAMASGAFRVSSCADVPTGWPTR